MDRNKSDFWKHKTGEQLAKEQNVRPQNFDELMKKGKGRKLWRSDKEFEEFLAHLSASRKAKHS